MRLNKTSAAWRDGLMQVQFTKISDVEHEVCIVRADQSSAARGLNSRSLLFHDLAHLAVETELPLLLGYWGVWRA